MKEVCLAKLSLKSLHFLTSCLCWSTRKTCSCCIKTPATASRPQGMHFILCYMDSGRKCLPFNCSIKWQFQENIMAQAFSILLVDDSPDHAALMRDILQPLKMVVHLANSGNNALEMLLAQPYDILLTDLAMPGMDGMTLLKKSACSLSCHACHSDHLLWRRAQRRTSHAGRRLFLFYQGRRRGRVAEGSAQKPFAASRQTPWIRCRTPLPSLPAAAFPRITAPGI